MVRTVHEVNPFLTAALVRTLGDTKTVYIYRLPDTYAVRDVSVYTKRNGDVTRSMRAFMELLKKKWL